MMPPLVSLMAVKRKNIPLVLVASLAVQQAAGAPCTEFDKEASQKFTLKDPSYVNAGDPANQALIFKDVAVLGGTDVDMVISAMGKDGWTSNSQDPDVVDKTGMAKLNFACGLKHKVQVCFLEAGTENKPKKIKVPKVAITLFDIDGRNKMEKKNKISMTEITAFENVYSMSLPTNPNFSYVHDPVKQTVVFTSKDSPEDNPKSTKLKDLTRGQTERSATVYFKDRNCFSMEVDLRSYVDEGEKNTRHIYLALDATLNTCTPATTAPATTAAPISTSLPPAPPQTPPPPVTPETPSPTAVPGIPTPPPPPPTAPTPSIIISPTPQIIIKPGPPSEDICDGFEEEFIDCGLPDCDQCVPVNCKFGGWSAWVEHGGCSGLQMRQRSIALSNNECGEPCAGAKEETRRSPNIKPECQVLEIPCKFTDWDEWSTCVSDADQSYRNRAILSRAENGGAPCEGLMKETKSCGEGEKISDCVFDDWQDWTACSSSCGKGRHTKMRVVKIEAAGGIPCNGSTLITEDCEDEPCPDQDCVLGDWEAWSICHSTTVQKVRTRKIKHPVMGKGKACDSIIKETAPCFQPEPEPCGLSKWTEWADCDKTCDGGQTFKSRRILQAAKNGGSCPDVALEITTSCNEVPCEPPPKKCELGSWGPWADCSSKCGSGSQSRLRAVKTYAEDGGEGCTAPLKEVQPCEGHETDCGQVDCEWGDWYDWSACSCSCGGGTKRRNRVVEQAPENGGKLCEPRDKSEAAPCNTGPCPTNCQDGKWGAWSEWSVCSATCDMGYRSRSRVVAVEANPCGKALAGLRTTYEKCPTKLPPCVPDQDCLLADWSAWSDCSCTCFGIMERTRGIAKFVSGAGKPCEMDALKEIAPCNPSIGGQISAACGNTPIISCKWTEWAEWSTCSRTCGGGQRKKERKIATPASGGGVPCKGAALILQACHGQDEEGDAPCDTPVCEDCLFGPWGSWSECSHCGEFSNCGGQKFRHRVPERLPNFCGKPCEITTAKEVTNCTHGRQDILQCRWSDWSASSGCGGCGPAVMTKNRVLGFNSAAVSDDLILFKGVKTQTCSGAQISLEECAKPDYCPDECVPEDCSFNEWSDWGPPECEGLCERKRTVKQVNNHCGKPCDGPLVATKECNVTCRKPPVDCVFSPWSSWDEDGCSFSSEGHQGQKVKTRKIIVFPKNGGMSCEGPIKKTEPCSIKKEPGDCVFGAWSVFEPCTATCGGGVKTRKRRIITHAEPGGDLCIGSLKEMEYCGEGSCFDEVDCKFTAWGEWGGCEEPGQMYRYRRAVGPIGIGQPCTGTTVETHHCPHPPVNCLLGDWTAWDACDKNCGGGQKRRQRQIQRFNKNGGKHCGYPDANASLMQTSGCNTEPCGKEDCEVDDWGSWTTCTEKCGYGQQSRTRSIINFRTAGGSGCLAKLSETQECGSDPALVPECGVVDCAWDEWSEWSGCTCTCEGGMKTRTRHIKTAPRNGGKPCDVHAKEEVSPCNTGPCQKTCTDGEFGPWSPFTMCSATCGGGTTYRVRKIAVVANECGKPPEGKEMETHFCKVNVGCTPAQDCLFGEWGFWSDCSTSCDGIKRRERRVKQYGYGDGKFCEGALKETSPCLPGVDEKTPSGCGSTTPPVDCKLSEWAGWDTCSATCDQGIRKNTRTILVQPEHGGKACEPDLIVVEQCNLGACKGPEPIDCKVGDWQDWGGCYKCGGLRKRFRHVLVYPKNGGERCPDIATEEVGACKRSCHDKQYCTWNDWGTWSACPAKCGAAKKSRKRYLMTTYKKKVHAAGSVKLYAQYDAVLQRTHRLQDQHGRIQELALAFSCGGLTLVVAFTVWRATLRNRRDTSNRDIVHTPRDGAFFDRTALEMRVPLGGAE